MADDDASAKRPVESPPPPRDPRVQASIVIVAGLVFANVAFFFLSMLYARARQPADLSAARLSFATMSAAITAASIAVVYAARVTAHALAAAMGVVEIVFGALALAKGITPVLGVALLVGGAVTAQLVYASLQRRSRGAWSFLVALSVVLGVCTLFGAPKVRGQLDIGLWTALIYPGLKGVTVVALSMLRDDYRRSAA